MLTHAPFLSESAAVPLRKPSENVELSMRKYWTQLCESLRDFRVWRIRHSAIFRSFYHKVCAFKPFVLNFRLLLSSLAKKHFLLHSVEWVLVAGFGRLLLDLMRVR